MKIKQIRTIALTVVVLAGSIAVTTVMATEPVAPKPEGAPMPAPTIPPSPTPAPSKPRAQENDTKPPSKAPVLGSPAENTGKEAAPVKPEPAPAPAPTKPRAPESETKTPAKSQHLANGSGAQKPGGMPQPPAEITGKDGAPMVLIPVGEFTMGSDKGDDDEQPIHRVFLDSFYLDKFEVTNGRYAKFVEAIQSEPPWGFADKETPVLHQDQPVRWVNWMDAMGYCLWAGKRLPTEAEWEKAARGGDGRLYPWGNDPPTQAHAVFGLKEGADTVSAIGNRDKGKSPYGVHDMAGNLYEWTTDWYEEQFYTKNPAINPRGPAEGSAKVQRGGSYINSPYRLRSSFRTKGDPTEHDPNVGFRCAQDVPNQP
jgi:formylglycine-generating enzyme required for sulfatase activity